MRKLGERNKTAAGPRYGDMHLRHQPHFLMIDPGPAMSPLALGSSHSVF
jgi:hypothetical protein